MGQASDWGSTAVFTKRWQLWVLLFWIVAAALLVYNKWTAIHWFALSDTDDNLRMMQVRALMAGQDWFDLRQYRMAPPFGADVHWSRIVDLPIAGLKMALAPLLGGAMAEKVAVSAAPLLPLLAVMLAIGATARRMLSPGAYAIAVALLLCAHSARGMFAPLRIDHHGWQLAMLSLALLSFAVRSSARGGLLLGLASAVSLAIGLEMLLYLALAGAATVLIWVRDEGEAPRLAAYGASLAGGTALGFAGFASYANRAAVCDALSPVWLSAMVAAGAVAVLLSLLLLRRTMLVRFLAAAAGGTAVGLFFVLAWPHCLGRLEGVPPELDHLWLSRVREALPVYKHSLKIGMSIAALPVAGLLGYAAMLWIERGQPERMVRWAAMAAMAALAAGLLLWQTRAGPAAQLLAVPGAAALVWLATGWVGRRWALLAPAAAVAAFVVASGLAPQHALLLMPQPVSKRAAAVNKANGQCPTLPALRPVGLQPQGTVLTFVDLGPRLIAVTHHDAIAGPYHRNHAAILDVMKAFRGTAENARATVERRGVDYVLICPGLSESTIYASEAKKGFYMQLVRGQVPDWMERVTLPPNSPYRMWRVRR